MSTYKIVYSDIRFKPANHLPKYWSTDFRSFERAMKQARRLHKQKRDIVLIESDKHGCVATWELTAGYETVAFDFNEKRTDLE